MSASRTRARRGICLALILFLVTLCAVSCAKPATFVMDEASRAYFEWQGLDEKGIRKAGQAAGFSLAMADFDASLPAASQIDALKPGSGVFIFPPLLSSEALDTARHYPQSRIVVLGSTPAEARVPVNVLAFSIDRDPALKNLAQWAASRILGPAHPLVLLAIRDRVSNGIPGRAVLEEDLKSLLGADLFNTKITEKIYAKDLSQEDLRTLSNFAREGGFTVIILLLDTQNAEFLSYLGTWKGLIASENAGFLLGKVDSLRASIDLDWKGIITGLLKSREEGRTGIIEVSAKFTSIEEKASDH